MARKMISILLAAIMLLLPVVSLAATAACDHPSKELIDVMRVPTCTSEGSGVYKCQTCGDLVTDVIPALGHDWDGGSVTTAATCTADGVKTFTCSRCSTTRTEAIPALGHSWDSGSVTTPATCTAAGVKTFTCTRCGSTYTEAIPATGHTPEVIPGVAASCEAGGKTEGSRCSTCGAILSAQADIPATGHNWGGWVVDVPPNCEQGGLEYMTCQN